MPEAPTEDQVLTALYALSRTTTLRVFPCIIGTVLFAIFTVLIFVSTSILLTKGLRSWPNRIMLVFTLLMYAVSAGLWAISLKLTWNELNVLIPGLLSSAAQSSDSEDNDNTVLFALNYKWSFFYTVLFQININLSDAVLLWRVYVIWDRRKSVAFAIAAIFLSLIGVNITVILIQMAVTFPTSVPKYLLSATGSKGQIYIAYFSVSAFANVWATFMVAWKAWSHRQGIRRYLRNRNVKGSAESILMMLVESSVVYSILITLQIFDSDTSVLNPLSSGPFCYYYTNIMNQVSGMYPTVVVVLAALQKLHGDHQFSFVNRGPDATLPFSNHISFSQTSERASVPRTQISFAPSTPVDSVAGVDQDDSETSSDVERTKLQ